MGLVVQKCIEHLGYEMKVLRCFVFLIGIFLDYGFRFYCMNIAIMCFFIAHFSFVMLASSKFRNNILKKKM